MPGARGEDALAQHWLAPGHAAAAPRGVLAVARARRSSAARTLALAALPPFADRALAALDLARYDRDKHAFFADDVTAAHLSERIARGAARRRVATRGSFGWVAQALALTPVECFVLAVALLPVVDSAAGSVIATCLNDPARSDPTLALAQRLWDEPDELLRCFDPAHPLLRHGLLVVHAAAESGDCHRSRCRRSWRASCCSPAAHRRRRSNP